MWNLSQALKPECYLLGEGRGRAGSLGFINGNPQVLGGSQQREGRGRRSRKLVTWSSCEPGLRRPTDQGLYLAANFYNQELRVLYKMGE